MSNTTFNTTNSTVIAANNHALQIFSNIFCIFVILFGTVGNTLVLIVFISKWAELKSYELFIVSLALADFLGTLVLPTVEIHIINGGSFESLGITGCKIVYSLVDASIYISSLNLTMVSADRYIAIKWPFRDRRLIYRTMITLTWIVGLCEGFQFPFYDDILILDEDNQCSLNSNKYMKEIKTFTLVRTILQDAIPLLTMVVLYTLISYELQRASRCSRNYIGEEAFCQRSKSNQKTTKMLIVLVTVFTVCVTPSSVFYLYNIYYFASHGKQVKGMEYLIPILLMLKMANSCLNPFIYGKLHTSFRKRVIYLVTTHLPSILRRLSCDNCAASLHEVRDRNSTRQTFLSLEEGEMNTGGIRSLCSNNREVFAPYLEEDHLGKEVSYPARIKKESLQNVIHMLKLIKNEIKNEEDDGFCFFEKAKNNRETIL